MKKFFALFMVVAMLVVAGSAFAASTDDIAGHGTPQDPETGSEGSEGAQTSTVTETVTTEAFVIPAVSRGDSGKVTMEAYPDVAASYLLSKNDDFTDAQKDTFAQLLQNFTRTIVNAVSNLISLSPAFSGATPGNKTDLEFPTSSKPKDNVTAEWAAKNNGTGQTPAATFDQVRSKTDGVHNFSSQMPKYSYGKRLGFDANPVGGGTRSASLSVRAQAEEGAYAFFNSKGESIDTVPGEDKSDVVPGLVTVAMFMKAGEVYQPVITLPVADVADVAETKTVTYTEEKVVSSTSTFSTNVSERLLTGTEFKIIPADAVSSTGWEYTDNEKDSLEEDSIFTLVTMPGINAPSTATWYIAAVSFDRGAKTANDLASNAALEFFRDGATKEDSKANAGFFKANAEGTSLVALSVNDIFSSSSRVTRGYVAFQLAATQGASRPAIATTLKGADELTITPSRTSVTFDSPTAAAQTVTLSSNREGTTYDVTVSPLTGGLAATVSENILTLTPSAAGSYTVTVTGTNGTYTREAIISVTVNSGSETAFAISASPATVTFARPSAPAQTVTLSSNFVGATVTYSATVSPSTGLTATVSGSTLTLKPSAAGTYTVTVTGTNGTDTATTTVSAVVNRGSVPGSSGGGGCTAGFSALALAVLGAFIARRKK